ncbi:Hsp70 family protein [Paenibacillus antri]|uniref:Hsp70 family protein n=1 Tax=Paenibacillus antri TaxID=2582848 RepID=A0A5R9G562_9BACL|nr:Hsp70 family protein [Paenibacillus antri]TLS50179.1 Hsp70 family protein [Paenibacillus antri]
MDPLLVGIDFGTTNSSVAVLDPVQNRVHMKRLDEGETPYLIRTILSKGTEGDWIIGNQAAALGKLRDRSVLSLKTELRRSPDFSLRVDGQDVPLVECISRFLMELLDEAGIPEPESIDRLALSVPVNYDDRRKAIMEQAAVNIGVEPSRIWFLDEPVSVLWDCRIIPSRYALVFDFGGGTLDMAIMDKEASEKHRQAIVHHPYFDPDDNDSNRYHGKVVTKLGLDLGGDDLDDCLVKLFVERGKAQGNPVCDSIALELFEDPERLHKLKSHPQYTFYHQMKSIAEQVKRRLSTEESVTVDVPPLMPGVDHGIKDVTITAEQFYLATEKPRETLMKGLTELARKFNEATRLTRRDIGAVLLSGGSSLVPFVPDVLEELFPNARIVWDEEHLQTRIARGNARYTRSEDEWIVGDVVNASIGIYNHAGKETIEIIAADDTYPIKKQKRVATTKPNQTKIEIAPMVKAQGSDRYEPLQKYGRPILWRMNIRAHPGTHDVNRLTITYAIDKSQRLRVSAYDNLFKSEVGVEEVELADSGWNVRLDRK